MKTIVHNDDNLKENEINNIVKRAKVLIINSNDEFLLAKVNGAIHVIGGHVKKGETDQETIVREVKEEVGINILFNKSEPFINIKYFCKSFPNKDTNTMFSANYYIIKNDDKPNLDKTNLEQSEIDGNFELLYIKKDNVLKELKNSIKYAKNKNVIYDTIDVVTEYLKRGE